MSNQLFILQVFGGELGGPSGVKYLSSFILFMLWIIYVFFSSLKAYDLISFNP